MKKFDVKDHAPSLLPDGYDFDLVWSDEFDGDTLDMTKWDYRLCMMGVRFPAWTDKGVKIENSCAVFSVFEENGEVVSSQLQTGYNFMDEPVGEKKFGGDLLQWKIGKLHESKHTWKYGYFECRCRLQQMNGWWSAFWMQSPMIGASLDPKTSGSEVDIMESFSPGDVKHHNVFTGGCGIDLKLAKTGGKKIDDINDFHTFGLLWTENEYVFYIDGVEDGRISEYVSGIPEFLLISTETMGYRKEGHRPMAEALEAAKAGDTFLVDHVRVFKIK